MENNKKHIEELIREIDAEKCNGSKIDTDKIIRQANQEIEKREFKRRRNICCIATASILMAIIWILRIKKDPE